MRGIHLLEDGARKRGIGVVILAGDLKLSVVAMDLNYCPYGPMLLLVYVEEKERSTKKEETAISVNY